MDLRGIKTIIKNLPALCKKIIAYKMVKDLKIFSRFNNTKFKVLISESER